MYGRVAMTVGVSWLEVQSVVNCRGMPLFGHKASGVAIVVECLCRMFLHLFTWADKFCTDILDNAKGKGYVVAALRMAGYPRGLVSKNWEPSACSYQPEESDTPTCCI